MTEFINRDNSPEENLRIAQLMYAGAETIIERDAYSDVPSVNQARLLVMEAIIAGALHHRDHYPIISTPLIREFAIAKAGRSLARGQIDDALKFWGKTNGGTTRKGSRYIEFQPGTKGSRKPRKYILGHFLIEHADEESPVNFRADLFGPIYEASRKAKEVVGTAVSKSDRADRPAKPSVVAELPGDAEDVPAGNRARGEDSRDVVKVYPWQLKGVSANPTTEDFAVWEEFNPDESETAFDELCELFVQGRLESL
ncbi:hypothetical protein [Actinoplanes derwentensis]|uniref:Uncharacterized protein n=1 Tax=Actinoplanes derwentensis TaxID=113562 RepID=A0A1H1V1R0_9ACTN|nr:hypothetical protein [Actinoplanes derwentensis]GID89830.1 hypothetical protein Ade03nite_87540 [Actinoplanes derwentensis]SDS78737.1 hypothetical protein SAMN04489716_1615 [Actinoplanes derwentensis]